MNHLSMRLRFQGFRIFENSELNSPSGLQKDIKPFFERYSAPLHDADNKFLGRIWYFCDITQTKELEEEMLKMKTLESAGVLAGGIAHDFNNILTAVLGNIQLSAFHLADDDKACLSFRKQKRHVCRLSHYQSTPHLIQEEYANKTGNKAEQNN